MTEDITFEKIEKELERLPKEFRSRVYNLAYMLGHSAGIDEVYSYICDIVEAIEQPIENYANRVALTVRK